MKERGKAGKCNVSLGNSSQGWANFPIRNSLCVHLPRKTEQQQQQLFWLLHRLWAMFPELKSHQRPTIKYTEDRNLVKMWWGSGRITRKADYKLKGRQEWEKPSMQTTDRIQGRWAGVRGESEWAFEKWRLNSKTRGSLGHLHFWEEKEENKEQHD